MRQQESRYCSASSLNGMARSVPLPARTGTGARRSGWGLGAGSAMKDSYRGNSGFIATREYEQIVRRYFTKKAAMRTPQLSGGAGFESGLCGLDRVFRDDLERQLDCDLGVQL